MEMLPRFDTQRQCGPHKGNKHGSINTLALVWGVPQVTLRPRDSVFQQGGREGRSEGGGLFSDTPGLAPFSHRCCRNAPSLLCASLVFAYTLWQPQTQSPPSSPLHISQTRETRATKHADTKLLTSSGAAVVSSFQNEFIFSTWAHAHTHRHTPHFMEYPKSLK